MSNIIISEEEKLRAIVHDDIIRCTCHVSRLRLYPLESETVQTDGVRQYPLPKVRSKTGVFTQGYSFVGGKPNPTQKQPVGIIINPCPKRKTQKTVPMKEKENGSVINALN